MIRIGNSWDDLLADEWEKPYYKELRSWLAAEYSKSDQDIAAGGEGLVYPPAGAIYNALRLTDYDDVKAVILGQDPYHEPGQAQGLAFSVPGNVPMPPSLVNILKELDDDPWEISCSGLGDAGHGYEKKAETAGSGAGSGDENKGNDPGRGKMPDGVLVPWAGQGVLLLNTVLTVGAHQAASHRGRGWEQFTDRVIELLAARTKPVCFVLWGAQARAKRELILRSEVSSGIGSNGADEAVRGRRHLIIEAPHPSPLSAYRGFFGGRYFSRINWFLTDNGIEPIDWSLR